MGMRTHQIQSHQTQRQAREDSSEQHQHRRQPQLPPELVRTGLGVVVVVLLALVEDGDRCRGSVGVEGSGYE